VAGGKTGQVSGGGNVKIIRVGSTDYSRSQMRRRVLNYLTYVAFSVPRALFVPCDVVVGMTDPPFEGIVAAFVAMLKRKPFVYNIRDLYPDMAVGGSIIGAGLLARVWDVLHRWALRRATRVVVLGEDMRAANFFAKRREKPSASRWCAMERRFVGRGASLRRTKKVVRAIRVISSLCWCTRGTWDFTARGRRWWMRHGS